MSKKVVSSLLTIALATSVVGIVDLRESDAAAKKRKTLLEQLFPKASKRAKERRRLQNQRLSIVNSPASKKPVTRKAVKKVDSARYYAYKVEGFRKFKSVKILAAAALAQEAARIELDTSSLQSKSVDMGYYLDSTSVQPMKASISKEEKTPRRERKLLSHQGVEKVQLKGEAALLNAVEAHYSNVPEYLWIDGNFEPKDSVEVILNIFETADAYGLNPQHYKLASINELILQGYTQEEAATQFEFLLTVNAIRYMADARSGKINPNRISGYHDFSAYKRDYRKHLTDLVGAQLPAQEMFGAHPNNVKFTALKTELEKLLAVKNESAIEPINKKLFLKPAGVSEELPKVVAAISKLGSDKLREKHNLIIKSYNGSNVYVEAIVDLVKDFQAEKKLTPDGIIGKNTLRTMVIESPKTKIDKIKFAMERLRWLPNNFGGRHVFINQPAYNASYIVNGKVQLSMRAIVGKKKHQTNFFYDTIESVVVNPYWNVPRSILVNEKLSKLQSNPYYYQQRGYEILKHGGKVVDPGSLNWFDEKTTKKYRIRQLPGGKNALGEVKILFPNKHNIYMHDTPSRGLFKRSSRALSHGCIRLHDPRGMAAAMMGTSVKKMTSLINAGKNKAMAVPNKMPVYVSYFTAFPRANGEIGFYPDIYDRDKALVKAFKATSKARAVAVSS